jgi:hypothetical protein
VVAGMDGIAARRMRARGAAIILVLSAVSGCHASSPPGWRQYEADRFLTFMGPPDLALDPRRGIDSYSAVWRGSRLRVCAGVLGPFDGGLAMGVRGKKVTVGGHGAMLYVDKGIVSPTSNPTGKVEVGLESRPPLVYVLVTCDSLSDLADAIYLVKSVRYTGLNE